MRLDDGEIIIPSWESSVANLKRNISHMRSKFMSRQVAEITKLKILTNVENYLAKVKSLSFQSVKLNC